MNKKNRDPEYVEVLVPDKLKLAEYIKQAKGPGRSMAEFANACEQTLEKTSGTEAGVSASTFSRIVNCKITKPLSRELLDAIMENAAKPEELDYKGMMRANGMIPRSERQQELSSGEDARRLREVREQTVRSVRNIIADEMYARDHMIQFSTRLPLDVVPRSRYGLTKLGNFVLHIQGYEPMYWNFSIHSAEIPEKESDSENEIDYQLRVLMKTHSQLFLRDIWEPEAYRDVKNSIVFTRKDIYDAFLDRLRDVKVHTWISIILVDLKSQKVEAETILVRQDGKTMKSIFDEERMLESFIHE